MAVVLSQSSQQTDQPYDTGISLHIENLKRISTYLMVLSFSLESASALIVSFWTSARARSSGPNTWYAIKAPATRAFHLIAVYINLTETHRQRLEEVVAVLEGISFKTRQAKLCLGCYSSEGKFSSKELFESDRRCSPRIVKRIEMAVNLFVRAGKKR